MTVAQMPLDEDKNGYAADALARAAVYRLLAGSLAFPSIRSRQLLRDEVFPTLTGLRTGSKDLDDSLLDAMALHDGPLDGLRVTHGTVFTHIDSPDAPAYESAYCPGDVFRQAEVMADIAGFYLAHGVAVGGLDRERPDHIATELEFMAFLARKQAHALLELGQDEIEECEHSQRLFLGEHLGCWAQAFAARLQIVGAATPFASIGRLLAQWLATELDWLGVEPVATWTEPKPVPDPDDGSCGIDGAGLVITPVELSGR